MEDNFVFNMFFTVLICFLLLIPVFKNFEDRVAALESLHNEYICLECNSLLQK